MDGAWVADKCLPPRVGRRSSGLDRPYKKPAYLEKNAAFKIADVQNLRSGVFAKK